MGCVDTSDSDPDKGISSPRSVLVTGGSCFNLLSASIPYNIGPDGSVLLYGCKFKVVSVAQNPGLLRGHMLILQNCSEIMIPVLLINETENHSLLKDEGVPLSQYVAENQGYLVVFDHIHMCTSTEFVSPDQTYMSAYFLSEPWKQLIRSMLRMIDFFHRKNIVVGPITLDNIVMVDGSLKFQNLLLEKIPPVQNIADLKSFRDKCVKDYANLGVFIDDFVLKGKQSPDSDFHRFCSLLKGDVAWPRRENLFANRIYNIQQHLSLMTVPELEKFFMRCHDIQKYKSAKTVDYSWAVTSMTAKSFDRHWSRRIKQGTPLAPLLRRATYADWNAKHHVSELIRFFRNATVHMVENDPWTSLGLRDVVRSLQIVFPNFMVDFQFKLAENGLLEYVIEHRISNSS